MLMKNNDILIIHGTDYKNMTIRLLEQAGLAAPQVTYLMHELKERGLAVNTDIITVEEAKKEILKLC